jgi:cold shock CspA family protein
VAKFRGNIFLKRRAKLPQGVIRRLIRERYAGAIRTERGGELFFNRSQLQGMNYDSRLEGQRVEFEVKKGDDDRLEAVRIRGVKPGG